MPPLPRDLTALPLASPEPFVTDYDLTTGDRTELSGHALANWVAKTAGFLRDELDADVGTRVRLGVGTHWTEVIWILSTWAVGAVVVDTDADVAFVGPDLAADEPIRVASALHPLGTRFGTPPADERGPFIDYGAEVWSHPDAFIPEVVDANDPAVDIAGASRSHAELLSLAPDARRRLVTAGQLGRDVDLVVAAAIGGGSLVIARGGDPSDLARIAEQEHAHVH